MTKTIDPVPSVLMETDEAMPTLGGIERVIGTMSDNPGPFFGIGWGPKVLL